MIEDSPSSGQAQGPEQGQGKATDDVVETLIVSVWARAVVEDAAAAALAVQQVNVKCQIMSYNVLLLNKLNVLQCLAAHQVISNM